jgi:hypothetical protein
VDIQPMGRGTTQACFWGRVSDWDWLLGLRQVVTDLEGVMG